MTDLPRVDLWRRASSGISDDDPELRRHRIIRSLIDLIVSDLVYTSADRIAEHDPQSSGEVRGARAPLMALSEDMDAQLRQLMDFLFAHLYRHHRVVRMFRKAERILQNLFETFEDDYRQMPERGCARILQVQPDIAPGKPLTLPAYRVIADYLAGMTDRYALQEHGRLFDPYERA